MSENEPRETLEPMVLVTRESWGALPPKEPGKEMNIPIPFVVVSYMTDTEKGETMEECKATMQKLQKRHMEEQGLPDIAYSFVVGGDGNVYEGTGWKTQSYNAKFPEYDGNRLDLAYMGNLDRSELTWEMMKAGLQLLSNGVDSGLLIEEYNSLEDPDTAPELPEM